MLPKAAASGTHPTLILLHGRGADEEDLLGLTPMLDDRLLILSVRAPHTWPEGGGYTWYDVDATGTPEPSTFGKSYDALFRFIDDALRHYPVDRKRVALLGFSMGAVMSYALSLTLPDLFGGVVAHSGYVPERTSLHYRWQDLSFVRFFIAHGTADPVIPVQLARRAQELFVASNATIEYREYPMGHEISEQSLADAAAFLRGLIDRNKD